MLRCISLFVIFMACFIQLFAMMPGHIKEEASPQTIGYEQLFDQNNIIAPAFQNLFEILKAPQIPDNLDQAFNLVQGKYDSDYTWLRKGERYDSQAGDVLTNEQADAVINFCKNIGLFKDIVIPLNINGILVMGSTLQRMRVQVEALNDSIEKNPVLNTLPVYFIGGERMLSQEIGETQQNLYHPDNADVIFQERYSLQENPPEVNDERDMIRLVVNQSLSDKFENIVFIMSPKKEGKARATTMDGMELWFAQHNPPGGHYALVSSNPFVLYQQLVAKDAGLKFKRPDIYFSGYGNAINLEYYVMQKGKSDVAKILLDNFARIICEIKQLQS